MKWIWGGNKADFAPFLQIDVRNPLTLTLSQPPNIRARCRGALDAVYRCCKLYNIQYIDPHVNTIYHPHAFTARISHQFAPIHFYLLFASPCRAKPPTQNAPSDSCVAMASENAAHKAPFPMRI